ncbi:hypothetical protein CCR95_09190 [Thiocystis minor]|uniref:DUF29 domain-containing protein n=1 Tax=Thiocystis minor TaxID=61597 RepID=UPI0019146D28|nr:DUF29 domain-containing protein [Thiocystis minor]MBK5964256.1 hypothetical protein [Thiocystis minor]
MTDLTQLYQQDYSEWARRNRDLLRAGRFAELDIEYLLEELSDMGKSERDELESRLLILLAHLLKWQYQDRSLTDRWREFDGRSWRATIVEQRKRLAMRLRKSPGLKSVLNDAIATAYPDACDLASKETGLPMDTFPPACPYRKEQMIDDDYYPD